MVQLFEGKLTMNCVSLSLVAQELCIYNRKNIDQVIETIKQMGKNKIDEPRERIEGCSLCILARFLGNFHL